MHVLLLCPLSPQFEQVMLNFRGASVWGGEGGRTQRYVCRGESLRGVSVYGGGDVIFILTVLGLTTHTQTHTHTNTQHTHTHTQLTKLLHKPLVSYMREKFISCLVTINWSFNDELMDKQIKQLEGEVYAAASTMNIVFLDCDANFPEDFDNTNLQPHFVYVKVARQQVSSL